MRIFEFEPMDEMKNRLGDSGGGTQAEAILKATKLINSVPGVFDMETRYVAFFYLGVVHFIVAYVLTAKF